MLLKFEQTVKNCICKDTNLDKTFCFCIHNVMLLSCLLKRTDNINIQRETQNHYCRIERKRKQFKDNFH